MLLERFGTAGIPSDQIRKMLDRATRLAAALNRSPAQRAEVVRDLVEKVVDRGECDHDQDPAQRAMGGTVAPPASESPSDARSSLQRLWPSSAAVSKSGWCCREWQHRTHSSRCDPTLIKAIARGRAWFEELATGRARSLRGIGRARRHHPALCPAPRQPRLSEPGAGRGDPARPATRRTHRDASDRTRSAARLDRSAQTAGALKSDLDRSAAQAKAWASSR